MELVIYSCYCSCRMPPRLYEICCLFILVVHSSPEASMVIWHILFMFAWHHWGYISLFCLYLPDALKVILASYVCSCLTLRRLYWHILVLYFFRWLVEFESPRHILFRWLVGFESPRHILFKMAGQVWSPEVYPLQGGWSDLNPLGTSSLSG